MRALSLLASFLALWAGTVMLLSRLPWFRDSVSLAERLAFYAPTSTQQRARPWPGEQRSTPLMTPELTARGRHVTRPVAARGMYPPHRRARMQAKLGPGSIPGG